MMESHRRQNSHNESCQSSSCNVFLYVHHRGGGGGVTKVCSVEVEADVDGEHYSDKHLDPPQCVTRHERDVKGDDHGGGDAHVEEQHQEEQAPSYAECPIGVQWPLQ